MSIACKATSLILHHQRSGTWWVPGRNMLTTYLSHLSARWDVYSSNVEYWISTPWSTSTYMLPVIPYCLSLCWLPGDMLRNVEQEPHHASTTQPLLSLSRLPLTLCDYWGTTPKDREGVKMMYYNYKISVMTINLPQKPTTQYMQMTLWTTLQPLKYKHQQWYSCRSQCHEVPSSLRDKNQFLNLMHQNWLGPTVNRLAPLPAPLQPRKWPAF